MAYHAYIYNPVNGFQCDTECVRMRVGVCVCVCVRLCLCMCVSVVFSTDPTTGWQGSCNFRAGLLAKCIEPNITSNASTLQPSLTLQAGIRLALAPENTVLGHGGTRMPAAKIYSSYTKRAHFGMRLWSKDRREKRNNWKDLVALPFPRYEPIERRLERWNLTRYFDMSSLVVDDTGVSGSLPVRAEYAGREDQVLLHISNTVTIFFYPRPVSWEKGTFDGSLLDFSYGQMSPKLKDAAQVDWFRTIMATPDVSLLASVTPEQIVDDWRCDNATHTHPDDAGIPCNPACDLRNHLTIDFEAETAMLTDTERLGPDGTKFSSSWWVLKGCVSTDEARKQWEILRHNQLNQFIGIDLDAQFFSDFTDPDNGLRARMTWFFLNFYATPGTAVQDNLLMYKQYESIWRGALGNYRTLSLRMFNDGALRKSLDQLEEVECGTGAPSLLMLCLPWHDPCVMQLRPASYDSR